MLATKLIFLLGATLFVNHARPVAAALLRRRTTALRNAGGHGNAEICRFEVFGKMRQEGATPSNLAFESEGVLVINDEASRVLVFKSNEIAQNGENYCHEQAEVKCKNKEVGEQKSMEADAALLDSAHALNLRGVSLDDAVTAAKPTAPTSTAFSSSGGGSGLACSAAPACEADDMPGLSYIRSMLGGSFAARNGKISRVASIGLGAGSIPLWFSRNVPNAEIDTIDVNENVIKAAPCFGVVESPKLRLVQEDGRKYLQDQQDGTFDIIFVDAFDDHDYIPKCLRTAEFFKMVRAKLSPGGVLAMNSWKRELDNVYSSMKVAFSDPGSSVQVGTSPGLGNLVLLATGAGGPAGGDATSTPSVTGVSADAATGWNIEATFDTPSGASQSDTPVDYRNVDGKHAPVTDAEVCSAYAHA